MKHQRHANAGLLALAAALLLPAMAHAQAGGAPEVAKTAPQTAAELAGRINAVLPASLPGWTITEAPAVCDRTCIAQNLPQDAVLTSTYNFRWCLTLRLMPPEPRQPIEARVFCMGEDLHAFGMFAHYRGEKTVTGQIATQSFWTDNDFHIWRGAFYIRLIPASGDKLLRASVVAAGEATAAQIPIPEKLPAMMRLLPQGRNQPYTLRYDFHGVLGQPTLSDGLVDTYLEEAGKLTLALLRAADDMAAVTLYGTVVGLISGGAATAPVADLGQAAVTINSAQHGLCYVMREGRYVAVALGVHDRPTAEGLLRITGTNIRVSRF